MSEQIEKKTSSASSDKSIQDAEVVECAEALSHRIFTGRGQDYKEDCECISCKGIGFCGLGPKANKGELKHKRTCRRPCCSWTPMAFFSSFGGTTKSGKQINLTDLSDQQRQLFSQTCENYEKKLEENSSQKKIATF